VIVVNFGSFGLIERMKISRRSRLRIGVAVALALVGAVLMILVDHGGIAWLKFALYAIFFSAIFLTAVLSPVKSCRWSFLRRQAKT
jgi:hypothetical protein